MFSYYAFSREREREGERVNRTCSLKMRSLERERERERERVNRTCSLKMRSLLLPAERINRTCSLTMMGKRRELTEHVRLLCVLC